MMPPKNIKLIAGLGNSGGKYEQTYHNVGIAALEKIIENNKSATKQKSVKGVFDYYEINGAILIRPLCFMNESGSVIKTALGRFRVKPEELLIIHDDSDIEIGDFKLSFGRNSGGHKGIDSIIGNIKTKNFWRLRVGIRPQAPPAKAGEPRPARRGGKASEFVLKKISARDREEIAGVLKKSLEPILRLFQKNIGSNL